MKKFILTFLLIATSTTVAFSSKPKLVVDNIDPFTQERTIETSVMWLTYSINNVCDKTQIYCTVTNDNGFIVINCKDVDNLSLTDKMEYKLLMINEEGDILSIDGIDNIDIYESTKTTNIHWGFGISSGSQQKKYDLSMKYPLNRSTAEKILNFQAQYLRIQINNNKFDYKLDNKIMKTIHRQIKLVEPYI